MAVLRAHRLAVAGLPVAFAGFEAVGVDVALPVAVTTLAQLDELGEAAAAEGLRWRRPSRTPPTGLAHLLEDEAAAQGLEAAVRTALYRAYWEADADLADPATLLAVGVDAGMDPTPTAAALADTRRLARLRRRMAAHRQIGVGGVPVLQVAQTLVPGLLPEDDLWALAAAT